MSSTCSSSKNVDRLVDGIRTAILRWSVPWLEEQKIQTKPPDVCRQPAKTLKLVYETYKDYETTMVPLLMHETWAQLYDEWSRQDTSVPMDVDFEPSYQPSYQPSKRGNLRDRNGLPKNDTTITSRKFMTKDCDTVPAKIFNVGIVDYMSEGENLCAIKCQSVIDSKDLAVHLKYVGEGDLVQIDLITETEVVSAFAYVENVAPERAGPYTKMAECYDRKYRNAHVVHYDVVIAKRRIRLNTKFEMKMRFLYYLKPILRQFESIFNLQESPLAYDIICPRVETFQLYLPSLNSTTVSVNFNEMQQKIILGVNKALQQPQPKIQLIQGPPGTGKTHTLIGIVKHLYSYWRSSSEEAPKILICAPSNGAIDEVTKRLLDARGFMKQTHFRRSLRMVRVGNPDHINPSVKKISLDELVEANEKEKLDEVKRKAEMKVKNIEQKLARYDSEIASLRNTSQHGKIPDLEFKMTRVFKELEACKSSAETIKRRETSEASKRSMRMELVKKADIILATLNSCQRNPIDILFKGDRSEHSFYCIIIDEASQCCEPEVLMALRYNVSKLILIGDPMQLPATVISRYAQEYCFGRSLFERLFLYFGKYNSSSPVVMLTQQYRMHPEICHFPSKKFYDNRLISIKSAENTFILKPYTVIDLKHSKESRGEGKSLVNEAEAELVRSIIQTVIPILPENASIGVITPYKSQKKLISQKLQRFTNKKDISIQVNTCDGFQGQERDVIILSCVRSFESEGTIGFLKCLQRINVALTRAKHANIVCISAKALEQNNDWLDIINDAKRRNFFHVISSNPSPDILKNILLS